AISPVSNPFSRYVLRVTHFSSTPWTSVTFSAVPMGLFIQSNSQGFGTGRALALTSFGVQRIVLRTLRRLHHRRNCAHLRRCCCHRHHDCSWPGDTRRILRR